MKKIITLIAITTIVFACSTSKKNSKSNPAPAASNTSASSAPMALVKPANGIYSPGENELEAIRSMHADVTMEQLSNGYKIYTEGACVKCHGAKDIYRRDEARWKDIIEKMSAMAKLSEHEKDAVYKYVISVKAMQGK